jgi:integrase/recombinase XerD
MKNIDYLESFVDYMTEEEKSPRTIESYSTDVRLFMEYYKKKVTNLKRTDVTAYKEHLRGKGLATVTINKKLVALKQFIDFLNDRFELGLNVKIKQEKQQKQYSLNDEEILTEEDYRKLITAVREKNDTRTLALFETMYYSGMRVSEVLQLRTDHVKNRVNVIEDIKGKGAKYRKIFVKQELFSTLDKYLEVRKQPFSSTTKALFVGERGPMTRQTAHNLIKNYARLAGIDKEKAHVHNLRHLFGLNLAEKGVPIQDIAKLMGHTSIEVTKIYLEKPQSHYVGLINQL